MGCGGCGGVQEVDNRPLGPKSVQRAPEVIKKSNEYVNKAVEVFGILGKQHCFEKKPGDIPVVLEQLDLFDNKFTMLLSEVTTCINGLVNRDEYQRTNYKTLYMKVTDYLTNDLKTYVELVGEHFNRRKFNTKAVRFAEFKGKKSCDRIKLGLRDLLDLGQELINDLYDVKEGEFDEIEEVRKKEAGIVEPENKIDIKEGLEVENPEEDAEGAEYHEDDDQGDGEGEEQVVEVTKKIKPKTKK